MTTTLVETRETLNARRKSAAEIFGKYEDVGAMTDEDAAEIKRLNDETSELGKKFADLMERERIRTENEAEFKRLNTPLPGQGMRFDGGQSGSSDTPAKPEYKSPGAAFIEAAQFKNWKSRGGNQTASVEYPRGQAQFKTTFGETLAQLTNYQRVPGIVTIGTQRPHVADLLASGTTTAPTIRYVQEVSFTNSAAAVAEGALKPEAAFNTIEQDAPVRKIAVTAKVTDELFSDFMMMRDYINGRLDLMLDLAEDAALLNGTGTAPQLTGLLNVSGIQTQATAADPAPDAVYRAMVKIMTVGYFDPDGIVMNPLNWQAIRLLRTTQGAYLFGNPADAAPERLWGLTVVATTVMTSGTALVGAFKLGGQVWMRDEGSIEATNSNEDDFRRNLIAIRDEIRLALAVYRPLAFCTVTGLP